MMYTPQTDWSTLPSARAFPPSLLAHACLSSHHALATLEKAEWVAQCTQRLRELRPEQDQRRLAALVDEMWCDVGSFDPVIAAEMEHESTD